MSDDLPSPLVAADSDLRDFPFTPVFRARLFGSDFHAKASDSGWRAGFTLWLKSWDQMPAGSLPDDDISLCRLAELGRDIKAWGKVSGEALHGWIKCSDGRLYHPVVAEGVNEAVKRKSAQRDRTAKARAARLSQRLSQSDGEQHETSVTENAIEAVTGSKGQGQGQGYKKEEEGSDPKEGSAANVDFKAMIFGPCLLWVADRSGKPPDRLRSMFGRWISDHGEGEVLSAISAAQREGPIEPIAWIGAALNARGRIRRHRDNGGITPMPAVGFG